MIFYLFFLSVFIIILNKFLLKKSLLLSDTGDSHQKLASKLNVPLTGGIFIFLGFFYFLENNIYSFILSSFTILILGTFSDLKLIKSAGIRFLLQMLLVIFFIFFNDIQITDTRIDILDKILSNFIINYLFLCFCILIVINGTNFIDGLNTLVIGYYLIIMIIIYFLNLNESIILKEVSVVHILSLLIIVFILNSLNKIYLGDAGSYLLGFSYAIFLIDIYNLNSKISPFFIILLLWYPCFENLFSIIRKNVLNKSPMYPDRYHFHQLIFSFIKKRFNLKIFTANIFTAQLINFYNLIIFIIGSQFIYHTKTQILLIFINIFLYSIIYIKLSSFKDKLK
tara:strand:- start:169 stop:1185 length:1017 start_codon:yes stop_codon:yes gene_type:complete